MIGTPGRELGYNGEKLVVGMGLVFIAVNCCLIISFRALRMTNWPDFPFTERAMSHMGELQKLLGPRTRKYGQWCYDDVIVF